MKNKFVLIGILLLLAMPTFAAKGLVSLGSEHDVATTMDRLEKTVLAKGFKVFARVDHGAGAASVDMKLRPTQLLIFGKPKVGTLLMQAGQTIGIDLPLKILVWEEADGKVRIGWNEPAYINERHGIANDKIAGKVGGVLRGLASAAAGS